MTEPIIDLFSSMDIAEAEARRIRAAKPFVEEETRNDVEVSQEEIGLNLFLAKLYLEAAKIKGQETPTNYLNAAAAVIGQFYHSNPALLDYVLFNRGLVKQRIESEVTFYNVPVKLFQKVIMNLDE